MSAVKKYPSPPSLTEEQLSALTDIQRERWETWNHPNVQKGRHERLYDENGNPRFDMFGPGNRPGRERWKYVAEIEAMDMKKLEMETWQILYMCALTAGNRRPTDWDWMSDCCYDELMRRTGTSEAYSRVYEELRRQYS